MECCVTEESLQGQSFCTLRNLKLDRHLKVYACSRTCSINHFCALSSRPALFWHTKQLSPGRLPDIQGDSWATANKDISVVDLLLVLLQTLQPAMVATVVATARPVIHFQRFQIDHWVHASSTKVFQEALKGASIPDLPEHAVMCELQIPNL